MCRVPLIDFAAYKGLLISTSFTDKNGLGGNTQRLLLPVGDAKRPGNRDRHSNTCTVHSCYSSLVFSFLSTASWHSAPLEAVKRGS